jgi:hypothetical protein
MTYHNCIINITIICLYTSARKNSYKIKRSLELIQEDSYDKHKN